MSFFERIKNQKFPTPPFFDLLWEKQLMEAFPYMSFEHYVYRGDFFVRIARIGGRVTTVPFSDGGDVFSRDGKQLSLKLFSEDFRNEFGKDAFVRVNEYYCPVVDGDRFLAPIVDFRVVLQRGDLMLKTFRKTLRHVLETPNPPSSSIECVKDEDSRRRVYSLYTKNMHQAAGITLPWKTFNALVDGPGSDLWVFKVGEIIHGASIFLNTETTSHYYISASSDMGKVYFTSHKLLWNAIRTYANKGKEAVFLGGTSIDSPLYTFKKGWRGEEYKVYSVGGATHERVRTSKLRSLWKLLPPSLLPHVTKAVGRFVF